MCEWPRAGHGPRAWRLSSPGQVERSRPGKWPAAGRLSAPEVFPVSFHRSSIEMVTTAAQFGNLFDGRNRALGRALASSTIRVGTFADSLTDAENVHHSVL